MNAIDREFAELRQVIPPQQPLVQALVDDYRDRQPLRGITALLIQHQLGNHVFQTQALIDLGLDARKIYWIDIPYTSTPAVRDALMALGIPADNLFTHQLKLFDCYATEQRRRVHAVAQHFIENPPDKLLVLDDGSYFLESIVCFERKIPQVAIVEQTTRGLIKIDENAALRHEAEQVPIINVAGSAPKKYLEPPFIAKAICHALMKKLADRYSAPHQQQCLVLGYGAIGRHVAQFIWKQLNFSLGHIRVYDPAFKGEHSCSFPLWDKRDLRARFDLVVGCSGRASFGVGDFVHLNDGAILASASSGSVELSRRDFIELAATSHDDDIWIDRASLNESNIHSDIPMHFPNRAVTFLNGGFPVNFAGNINCLPARYIQQTVAMMVRAAIQAVVADRGGVIPLDEGFCKQLEIDFRKLLGEQASILD